jgi:trk system potassium uptake protein TrkA
MQKVAVIGLGRFGLTLARILGRSGVEVLAMDRNGHLVDEVKDDVAVAVRLDTTDEDALLAHNIRDMDVCVVGIGENFEASLLTATILRKLGVKYLICRAQTAVHAEIFRRIGADEIIQPETQAAEELGRRLSNPHLEDLIQLAEGYSLIEMLAPRSFRGKTLEQIGLRTKYQVNLIGVRRPSANPQVDSSPGRIHVPGPQDIFNEGDILVLVGADSSLANLPRE